jgi:hypothetical protein
MVGQWWHGHHGLTAAAAVNRGRSLRPPRFLRASRWPPLKGADPAEWPLEPLLKGEQGPTAPDLELPLHESALTRCEPAVGWHRMVG